ncbi:MAG: lytic murein transglycosylase [Thermodesulfobacteriota bacterium]
MALAAVLFSLAIVIPTARAIEPVQDKQLIDLGHEKYRLLFTELIEEHNFHQEELDKLFSGVRIKRNVLKLMDKQWEAKPYYLYRPLFVTRSVIYEGKKQGNKYRKVLDRIEQELGVDREVILAIWGIESRFGRHKGHHKVFQSLNTLFDAYPRRSDFFREQLIHFLLLCRENRYDPLAITGSYAGAFGQTQFIPSSFREYSVSFDGDKRRDVFNSVPDILASIANYLRSFHYRLDTPLYLDIGTRLTDQQLLSAHSSGRKGRIDYRTVSKAQNVALPPPPDNRELSIVGLEIDPEMGGGFRYVAGYPNFHAITEWNHSNRYAMAVSELAEAIKD